MEYHNHLDVTICEELNQYERDFKNLYENSTDQDLSLPHDIKDTRNFLTFRNEEDAVLPLLFLDHLIEPDFFENGMDVAIYRHFRYLTPIAHQHSFFEVVCVLQGNCTNYIHGQELSMLPGDVCIIPPNTMHALSAFRDDCMILNLLLRTSTFVKTFLGDFSDTDILTDFFTQTLYGTKKIPYLLCRTGNDAGVINYAIYAYDESRKNARYKNRMLNSIISAFFISMLQSHEKDFLIPKDNGTFADENLIFILRYMQEHYNHITMKELAEFFNYSERHMQRILQTYTGMSFSENILKLKMKHAARMLGKSRMAVSKIAEELGYSNVSNFRHAFKKAYEMTPAQYRSEHLE